MSIKIFNMYKCKDLKIENLMKLVKEIEKIYIQEKIDYFKKYSSRIEIKDFYDLYDKINEEIRKGLNSFYNIEGSLVVYFYKNEIYIQIFGINKVDKEKLHLEEFNYWNNTDRPEEFGDEQWEEREKIIKKIFIDTTPVTSGLSYPLSNNSNIYKIIQELEIN